MRPISALSVAALMAGSIGASAAQADVTITMHPSALGGGVFFPAMLLGQFYNGIPAGQMFTGTLTGVTVDVTLLSSTMGIQAADFCVLTGVNSVSGIQVGALQVGGSGNWAANQYDYTAGFSDVPGTQVQEYVDLSALSLSISGANAEFFFGNGGPYAGWANEGTWSGSVILHGVSVVPIPGPGGSAFLVCARLGGRRRK